MQPYDAMPYKVFVLGALAMSSGEARKGQHEAGEGGWKGNDRFDGLGVAKDCLMYDRKQALSTPHSTGQPAARAHMSLLRALFLD